MPPVFLQDLTRATFTNSEQQDLHLVKHLIAQWAQALEDELNLKMFGRDNRGRYIEHNLDGLQRGDFLSRMNGIARAVQGGIMEPNRGRALMNWPKHKNPAADDLFIQGATVPLGTVAKNSANAGADAADTRRGGRYNRRHINGRRQRRANGVEQWPKRLTARFACSPD
jgi:hypothetical protein